MKEEVKLPKTDHLLKRIQVSLKEYDEGRPAGLWAIDLARAVKELDLALKDGAMFPRLWVTKKDQI